MEDIAIKDFDVCGQILADWDDDKEPTYYRREYKRIMKQLEKLEPEKWNFPYFFKKTDYSKRNEAVEKYCETHFCKCGGRCKQTRSGSLRIVCLECGTKYQLSVKK